MTNTPLDTNRSRLVELWLGAGFGGLLTVAGIYMIVSAPGLGLGAATGPGPGLLPLAVGGLLATVSAIYTTTRVIGLTRFRHDPTPHGADADPLIEGQAAVAAALDTATVGTITFERADPDVGIPRAVAIVISLIALALLLEPLGFQLAMLLFLFFQLKILGKQGWVLTVILSVAGSFGVFALFTRVLRVALPTSDIWFLRVIGL